MLSLSSNLRNLASKVSERLVRIKSKLSDVNPGAESHGQPQQHLKAAKEALDQNRTAEKVKLNFVFRTWSIGGWRAFARTSNALAAGSEGETFSDAGSQFLSESTMMLFCKFSSWPLPMAANVVTTLARVLRSERKDESIINGLRISTETAVSNSTCSQHGPLKSGAVF